MKALKHGLKVAALTLLPATELLAAEGARQDNSGVFVWIFLGICALIVTAQVLPALFMLFGAAKGVTEAIKERGKLAAYSKAE